MAGENITKEQLQSLLDIAKSHPEVSHRVEALKQLGDIILNADPFFQSEFINSLPALQSSPFPAVRKYVIQMIEEANVKNLEYGRHMCPFLLSFLKDDTPPVVRQTITSGTNIFRSVLDQMGQQLVQKGKLDGWLEEMWSWALKFKDEVYDIAFQIGSDGVKLLAVKFVEITILLFTADFSGQSSDGRPMNVNMPSLVGGHPLLDPAWLLQEAQKSLGLLLEQLQSPAISMLKSSVIIVIINSLAVIAKKRMTMCERIVPVLLGLDPNSESGKGGQVASVQHARKTALLTCLKCTNAPEASMWQEPLVVALKGLNAGEQADQILRQRDRMLRNSERALRDPRISKEERGFSQVPYGGSIRKRPVVHDNGNSTDMDDTSSKRSRSTQISPLSQNCQSFANSSPENGPSNGISVGGLVLDNELTPVQKMIAMIGALLAEGERGRESLELLISKIQSDLLADIVIANMQFLPTSAPTVSGRQGSLHQVSQANISTSGSAQVISATLGSLSADESPQQHQPSSDIRRDPRRDPRRMDPRRMAVPVGIKASVKVEDSNLPCATVSSGTQPPITGVVKSELPSDKLLVEATKHNSSGPSEAVSAEKRTDVLQDTNLMSVLPESCKSTISAHPSLTIEAVDATTTIPATAKNGQMVQDNSNEALKSSSETFPMNYDDGSAESIKIPSFMPLNSEQQSHISKDAFTRIVEALVQDSRYACRDLCCALLARLVAKCESEIDTAGILQSKILLEYQRNKGHDLTLHVLYHLYGRINSEPKDEKTSETMLSVYEKFLLAVAYALRDSLPASDKSLSKLLAEAPLLPDSALKLLEQLCNPEVSSNEGIDMSTGDRVTQGLGAVWSLILVRPVNRIACLNIALQCAVHELDEVRAKAIRLVANRLYSLEYLSHNIEHFATEMLLSVVNNDQASESKQESEDVSSTTSDENKRKLASEMENAIDGNEVPQDKASGSETQKGTQIATVISVEKAQRYMSLFFALCTKKHVLLSQLFDVYGKAPKTVKQAVHRHIPNIVRTISSSDELLKIISDPPAGSEHLLIQVLHFLTDRKTPSKELIATVKQLYEQKLKDPAILIPLLSSLSKEEVLPIFPRLVDLPLDKFRVALARILQGSVHTGPALTPAEVLIAIHTIDPERDALPLRKITDACSACFDQKVVFTQQVLEKVLNHLVEENPLPLLFMRTVIQAVDKFPNLVDFVMDILSRLIKKQIWRQPKLWVGFLKCAYQTKPHSYPVLLQLPPSLLENALNKHPTLRGPLASYASQANVRSTLARPILVILGLTPDNQPLTPNASTSQSTPHDK